MAKITATIITDNSIATIGRCLESLSGVADEIIVVADGQVRTSGTSDILPQLLADEKGPWCPLRKDV